MGVARVGKRCVCCAYPCVFRVQCTFYANNGGIRTGLGWLALGCVSIAVPAWVWNSMTMSEFLKNATAVNSSTHLAVKAAMDLG
jgi:hypothetical protein